MKLLPIFLLFTVFLSACTIQPNARPGMDCQSHSDCVKASGDFFARCNQQKCEWEVKSDYGRTKPATDTEVLVGCTEEAKLCPDGSVVVRGGSDCKFASCPINLGKDFCETASDCVCQGIDTQTNNCFLGNQKYYDVFVNKEASCADFCTGIDGRLETQCLENKCSLVRKEIQQSSSWLQITATPSEGEVPIRVKLIAKLQGVELNDPNFYCVRQKWEFGDGESISMTPNCIEYSSNIAIDTTFETNYRYEKPGKYDVKFSLGDLSSEFKSVVVKPQLLPPECDEDSDCVKAQCCHAADCIIKEKRPDCSTVFCNQECVPGTLDCGGGCACVYGRCTGAGFVKGELTKKLMTWQARS